VFVTSPQVVRTRQAYRDNFIKPLLHSRTLPPASSRVSLATLPTSDIDVEAGVVQIIDANVYPANPSCPFPTPTPAPGPRVTLSDKGACLWFNASAFPCFDSTACALTMGACDALGSRWYIPLVGQNGLIVSADATAPDGTAVSINVDCNKFLIPHTVTWALSGSGAVFEFNVKAQQLSIAVPGGLCLNSGVGPAQPACNPADPWEQEQVQLAQCSDASASGWVATVV
jgi:hypothetical protein